MIGVEVTLTGGEWKLRQASDAPTIRSVMLQIKSGTATVNDVMTFEAGTYVKFENVSPDELKVSGTTTFAVLA